MNVHLDPEVERQIRRKVEAGLYRDVQEVVNCAVREWVAQEQDVAIPPERLTTLREEIAAGIAEADEGRFVQFDAEHIIARGRRRLAERSGDH